MTTLISYATANDLQDYLKDVNVVANQGVWNKLLTRASRTIDHKCDDYFGTLDTQTLVFDAADFPAVFPNYSIRSLTAVETAPYAGSTYTTLTAAQYVLQPDTPPPNEPYRWLRFLPYGVGPFGFFDPVYNTYPSSNYPHTMKVRLTGNFGWPAVPDDIVHLTLKLAVRYWKGRDVSFQGIAGSAETGLITVKQWDDEDMRIVRYYSKPGFV